MRLKFLKRIVLFFCVLFTSQVSSAYECTRAITLGWEDWKPFQYEIEGNLTGLDIEVVTAIIENMGCKVRYVKTPWKRHLNNLEKGAIDLAASASKTPEREEYAFFSNGYRQERMVLFIKKDSDIKLTSLEQMLKDGLKLGIQKGVHYGDDFEAMKAGYAKQLQESDNLEVNVKKLESGRIDGFLAEDIPGVDYLKEIGKEKDMVVSSIVANSSFVHVMISKKSLDENFTKSFDESLEKIKASGLYNKILDKYLK